MKKWILYISIIFLNIAYTSCNLKSQTVNDPESKQDSTVIKKAIPSGDKQTQGIIYPYKTLEKDKTENSYKDYKSAIIELLKNSDFRIKGIYVPGWKLVNNSQIDKLIDFMVNNHLNNLIFDLKNANGEIFFRSENETALRIDSQAKTDEGRPRSIDIDYLIKKADEKQIKLTGRHVMFRDKKLYAYAEEYRLIEDQYWVDLNNSSVIEYNLALIKEEASFGLNEIALDYIRFPEVNELGTFDEKSRAIEKIVKQSATILSTSTTDFGIFVFGYVAWGVDVGIGQTLSGLETHVNRMYPMLYPSHFAEGTMGYAIPGDHPYEILNESCQKSIKLMSEPNKSIPMLQAFWYSPKQLFLQIKAVNENEMEGFVLWNARGNYSQYFSQ